MDCFATLAMTVTITSTASAARMSEAISGYFSFDLPHIAALMRATGSFTSFLYLKIEIQATVPWRVEILDETVAAEIAALPADMQARFLRLAERIASVGLESLSEPHVKHLEGKLWELRLTGRDGIARALYVTAIGRRVVVVRAFMKKTQTTPRGEIELALRRAKEIA